MKVSRIGLINFWLYDDEEFDFYDGKLLLRGTNGSGKSVTMQSFIPVILDGDKRPIRLDPFGTTDKHMEDYLLGPKDSVRKEEATGYLYMEVYDDVKDKYTTIGMGLHARIGKPIDFWGFALQDGRRIGKDFLLYHSKANKIPFSKKELGAALGTENILVDNTKDYKKMVNNLLFGFRSIEAYDEFINVLLQLRSPKLSKDYKPTKLMSILSNVLNPLTDEDLRPLSEAIEEMDNTKEKIEKLSSDAEQVKNLLITLKNYNETLLYSKALNYMEQNDELKTTSKSLQDIEDNILKCKQEISALEASLTDLEIETTRLTKEKENLDCKDIDALVNRLDFLQTEITNLDSKIAKKNNELTNKQTKEQSEISSIKNIEDSLYTIHKEGLEFLKKIDSIGETIKFTETYQTIKDLEKDFHTSVSFENLESRIKKYQNNLEELLSLVTEKENIENDANAVSSEIASLDSEIALLTTEIENTENLINNELRNIKDRILYLQKHNQVVKLRDEDIKKIFTYLNKYSEENFNEAKIIYEKIAHKFHESSLEEKIILQGKIKEQTEAKNKLEEELVLLEQSDEEKLDDNNNEQTIKYLKEHNISYTYFYEAIDYKESIDETTKNKLEAMLLNAGLLGSIIVSEKDLSKVNNLPGIFIKKTTKKKNNLTTYLKPAESEKIRENEILACLESISIDENDAVYLNPEKMCIDIMFGFTDDTWTSKYIGLLTRRKNRLDKINAKKKELDSKMTIIEGLNERLEHKELEISLINEEKDNFPSSTLLKELNLKLTKNSYIMESKLDTKNKKEETLMVLKNELETILVKIMNAKKDIALPLVKEILKDATKGAEDLVIYLTKLKGKLKEYAHSEELKISKSISLEDIKENISEIFLEISELETSKRKYSAEINDLKKQLNTKDYQNIVSKLQAITSRLNELPKEREEKNKALGKITANLDTSMEEKKRVLLSLENSQKLLALKENFLQEEYALGYVFKEEFKSTLDMAKYILSALKNRKESDVLSVTGNYYEQYNKYRLSLNSYHLTSITLFQKDICDDYSVLRKQQERFDIRATYQGKSLNAYELVNVLKDAVNENNILMSNQDQKLFEEILLKTIGQKIKMRIIDSREWVKNMNKIMAEMQNDSALSFSLIWRSKESSEQGMLDTKELERLLNIDNAIRKEEDSEKLINHFRTNLRKELEESDGTESYANIIFRVLDYRNWFEFKMTYQRVGDTKKELTDKVFSVFSGGEKAKTMYIPLFASVSAKLGSASKNALRLVALDEAFAGVDDINIKEMFGILNHLKLDYILTSQSLWGDYSTIKDLSIAQLIRPNNAPFVTVERYRWNGKTKTEIKEKEILNDTIELF